MFGLPRAAIGNRAERARWEPALNLVPPEPSPSLTQARSSPPRRCPVTPGVSVAFTLPAQEYDPERLLDTDELLMRKVARGDLAAFRLLMERWEGAAKRY